MMKNFTKTLKPSFLALDAHLYVAFTKIVTTWLNFTNHKTNQKKNPKMTSYFTKNNNQDV